MRLNLSKITLLVSSVLFSGIASSTQAGQENWVGASFGQALVKADSSDFDLAGSYRLQGGHWFSPNFAVEAGYSALSNAEEKGEDNRGSYKLTLDSDDLFVGPVISTDRTKQTRFFASGGVLYSKINIEVEESFFGLKPGGKASDENTSFGFYLNGGVAFSVGSQFDLLASLSYFKRSGAVKTYGGDVDVNDAALNLGANYRF